MFKGEEDLSKMVQRNMQSRWGVSLDFTYPHPGVYNEVGEKYQGKGIREGMAEERTQ